MILRAWRVLLLLGLAVAGCLQQPPGPAMPEAEVTARLGPFAPLHRYFAALNAAPGRPVTVLQIGDSHTANDAFSTAMREALQARFGDGGRGMLPPGIAFRTYNPAQVQVTATGWQAISSMEVGAPGPFGITAMRQRAEDAAAEMLLTADPGRLAMVELELLRQPGGGGLSVQVDGASPVVIRTGAEQRHVAFVKIATDSATRQLRLRPVGDGPVELLGWRTRRDGGGLTWSNLGTIGATIGLTARWDRETVAMELRHLAPDLLVVAFGTNEGFTPETDRAGYAALFTHRVQMLSAAAPGAAVLVLGPPDGSLPARAGSAGRPEPCESGRLQPPHLAFVRQAQRQAAVQQGWFFWDWQEAMGGDCAMARFVRAEPPLALPDHVHLRTAGYRLTAARLREVLDEGFQRYRSILPAD